MDNQDPKPWERQVGEQPKPWAAFVVYRDLGPGRSTAAVAKQVGKCPRLVERWCTAWQWVRRAAAWDAEKDRVARHAEQEAIRNAKREEVEALAKMRVRHIETSVALQTLGRDQLRKWLRRIQESPTPLLSPKDLRQLIEAGMKMERLTRGEPDTIQEHQDAADNAAKRKLLRPLLADPEATEALERLNQIALRHHAGDDGDDT